MTEKYIDVNASHNADRNADKGTDFDAGLDAGPDTGRDADLDTDSETGPDVDLDTSRWIPWSPNYGDLVCLPTETIAQRLLGTLLICERPADEGHQPRAMVRTAGVIVETEAYLGVSDKACHAFGGRQTPRLKSLWQGPGLAYIYTIHTHWLLNITTQPAGTPECVLIRALWPVEGLSTMALRRGVGGPPGDSGGANPGSMHPGGTYTRSTYAGSTYLRSLTSGPGKLCRAMGISGELNASEVLRRESALRIEQAPQAHLALAGILPGAQVSCGPRVGVDSAGADALLPLRFWFTGNRLLSKRKSG